MIYVKLKDRHVSKNLSFTSKERQKCIISKVSRFFEKQRMTLKSPSMQYKFYFSFYGGIIDQGVLSQRQRWPKEVHVGCYESNSYLLVIQIWLGIFTMLISIRCSTQLENLYSQKCTKKILMKRLRQSVVCLQRSEVIFVQYLKYILASPLSVVVW